MSEDVWTMALVKDGFHDLPMTNFHTHAILKNGEVIGKIRYDRGRWKSAGGPAWQGTLLPSHTTYYNKNRQNVLHWFKTGECR